MTDAEYAKLIVEIVSAYESGRISAGSAAMKKELILNVPIRAAILCRKQKHLNIKQIRIPKKNMKTF